MGMNWVAVGLSLDLPAGVVMPALGHGIELAVWRSASGRLSAWKDRCPHRGMRLSHGFVRGEMLNCIYHGWVYGTDGACRHIPAHPALVPPTSIKTEAFICREAQGVIWVALAAVTDAIPDLSGLLAVRSLSVEASPQALAQALPELRFENNILRGETPVGEVCLVLTSGPLGQTTVRALCEISADKIAVSRWLESLRRRVEQRVAA